MFIISFSGGGGVGGLKQLMMTMIGHLEVPLLAACQSRLARTWGL